MGFYKTDLKHIDEVKMELIVKVGILSDYGEEINTGKKIKFGPLRRDGLYLSRYMHKNISPEEVDEYVDTFDYDKFAQLMEFDEECKEENKAQRQKNRESKKKIKQLIKRRK